MVQANDVARPPPAGEDRLDRIVRPAFGEVAEKGIAGPERKEPERGAPFRGSSGKKPVYDFEARAVSSDSDEIAIAFRIGAIRKHSGFTRNARFAHFDGKARGAEPVQRRRSEFPAPAAARGWIHNREVPLVHRATIASRSTCSRICSARTMRLIFRPALRGKSRSQITYPATRL